MRLVHQLTLAMTGTLLGVVGLVAVSTHVSIARAFTAYLHTVEQQRLQQAVPRLEAVFHQDGDFSRLVDDPRLFGRLLVQDEQLGPRRPRERAPSPRRHAPHSLQGRATLYDERERPLVGSGSLSHDDVRLPLHDAPGRVIGVLGVRAIAPFDESLDTAWLSALRERLALSSLAALALGLVAAGWLARRLLRPITALSDGARRLAAGDYEVRIGSTARDELGALARAFDQLASTLAAEAYARRQWVADTSHELRTPLTVLRGELEALLDGVRPLNAAAVDSLLADVGRLQKLAEDLGELARSDGGTLAITRAPIDVLEVVRDRVAHFRPRFADAQLALTLTPLEGRFQVDADRLRVEQVLTNLLENSLRYTDPGGRLEVAVGHRPGSVVVTFDDSAPGVPAAALPRLFERFFRADASRSRHHGGAGLGLAIARRLTEAHGGTLTAQPSALGGLRVELVLPARGGAS